MPHSTELQDLQQRLREHGMKATPQRLAIAQLTLQKPAHTTAQQLFEQLRGSFPALSQNTVYLTLASFAECGLLRRFHAAGTMVFDSNTSLHDHACCQQCGCIVDIPVQHRLQPATLLEWELHGETCTWTGICPQCRS